MSSETWKVEPFSGADKFITLVGPSDGYYEQKVYLDFDDVNHDEIERRVPLIVEALNGLRLQPPDPDQEGEQ